MTIRAVVLCGGAGTRLWPESRGARAKQFLALTGGDSLFGQTIARLPATMAAPPLILCGPAHVEQVRAQLAGTAAELIVEPAPRGTAAAIALAVAASDADTLLLVMPSDHVVADVGAFHAAIARAEPLAQQDWLVTFGIAPERPDTGFGYIAAGDPLGEEGGFKVARFVEKPPLADAEAMLAAGGYSWNAGIFLFRAGRMRQAMEAHCPAIIAAADTAVAAGRSESDAIYADADGFSAAPATSIDYAVMECDPRVAVVPAAMGWSDLGSWQAVHDLAAKDDAGNAVSGDAFLYDSRNNLVRAGDKRVALVGMKDVAVIVDGDDILVMPLDRSQDVREAAKAREG